MRDWYLYTYDKAALASRQVGGNAHVAPAGNSVCKTTANWVGARVCVCVCLCVRVWNWAQLKEDTVLLEEVR